MNGVLIKFLEVVNFKGFASGRYEFGPITLIEGDNYQGKTSIAEAIMWGLYGVNLAGSNRTDDLIRRGADSATVTVGFEVGGAEHTVIRTKSRQGSRLVLDGRPGSQSDIERLVGPLNYFMASFWPTSVLAMKDQAAREFFLGLLPPLKIDDVVSGLNEIHRNVIWETQLDLRDPDGAAKELRARKQSLEQQMTLLAGSINAFKEVLNASVPKPVVTDDIVARLQQLEKELSELRNVKIPKLIDLVPLQQAEALLKAQWAKVHEELALLRVGIRAGDRCPTCGQIISQEAVEAAEVALQEKADELRRTLDEIVKKGKEAEAALKKAMAENEAVMAAAQNADQVQIRALEEERARLNQRLIEANRQNAAREALLQRQFEAQNRLAQLTTQAEEIKRELNSLTLQLQAVAAYVVKRAEMQAGEIERRLKRARLKLFEVVKTTGEIKPAFELLYDGKPVQVLSFSERIRLALEVAELVKKLAKFEWPTFLDNAESVTSYEMPSGQFFEARVVAGQPLTVQAVKVEEELPEEEVVRALFGD